MIKKRIKPYLIILILIALAVSPAFALGEGDMNLFLVGVMCLSPIIILNYGRFDRINPWLAIFIVSILLFPLIFHPESLRWSTVLYSVMFCLTFIGYNELLYHSFFSVYHYHKLLKYLIFAYFMVLVIQQFCVLTGLPVFNQNWASPEEPWKLNSLAAEPSHSARIMALLMYCYIYATEILMLRKYNFKLNSKKDKWVWTAFIWTMVTMGSGTAFLFIPIVLSKFLRFKNLIPLFIFTGLIAILVDNFEITAFERTYETTLATLTLDEEKIIETDHSASFRIVPIIVLAKMVNFTTLDSWFGYGLDYVKPLMTERMPGTGDTVVGGGGLLAIAIEYGFLSFLFFIIFSLQATLTKRNLFLSTIFWFMLVFFNGINSQIVWLCLILFFTNKYFEKSYKSLIKLNNE